MRLPAFIAIVACLANAQTPDERALNYLASEVPKWPIDNSCFSCHNNGDGARALYAGRKLEAVRSTTTWLATPLDWEKGKADLPGSDTTLARYQFSAALVSAFEAGAIQDRSVLGTAAQELAALQQHDGSWHVKDEGEAPGSPVTWGSALATYFGRRTLQSAGGHTDAVERAEAWLQSLQPRYTIDEAAVLLALPLNQAIRKRAVDRFARMQTSEGGWGPRLHAPAEVFDTAVVLLALSAAGEKGLVQRGREFLVRMQQQGGGWVETTRPSGSQSYAQHISTTAWATLALLATDAERK